MAYEHVTYEKHAHTAEVTINRQHALNALHPPSSHELVEIWTEIDRDPDIRVAILTGAGDKAFCAGFDLKWAAEFGFGATGGADPFGGLAYRPTDAAPPKVRKPIIAAVNGIAFGGGMEMALACDIIVAAADAKFGLTEARWGLIPLGGGVHWLPRHIPLKRAMGMLLTGELISAGTAFELGLVNEVVARVDVMQAARGWADRVSQNGPLAVQAIKQAVYEGLGQPYEVAQRRHYTLWDLSQASDEGKEGVRAFAEKRAPSWQAD
jgi:enoyl-CoA hydratase/carnithine racemase